MSGRNMKVCFVQPVQSPYWAERLSTLAQYVEGELVLWVEKEALSNRPGWRRGNIGGVKVDLVRSWAMAIKKHYPDLGYTISGYRTVPWQLPWKIWRERPSVVVTCNATQLMLAAIIAPFRRIRIVHNVEDTCYSVRNKGPLSRWIKACCYRRADRYLAYSNMAVEYLCSIGVKKGVIRTSWSMNFEELNKRKGQCAFRRKYGLEGKKIFLFAGALEKAKGVEVLVKAWQELPDALRENCVLIVAGDGSLASRLTDLADSDEKGDIRILGHVPYAELMCIYGESDVFVLPTLQDLFSLVVLEAMALGCAVITTKYNGASELVDDGRTGWVMEGVTCTEMKEVLTKAMNAGQELDGMKKQARLSVQKLDSHIVMRDLAKELNEVGRK